MDKQITHENTEMERWRKSETDLGCIRSRDASAVMERES